MIRVARVPGLMGLSRPAARCATLRDVPKMQVVGAGPIGFVRNVSALTEPTAQARIGGAAVRLAGCQALMDSLTGGEPVSTITVSAGRSTTILRGLAFSATGICRRNTPSW